MRLHKLYVLTCLVVFEGLASCTSQNNNVPSPEFRGVVMASTGKRIGLRVEGFQEFVNRYGTAGWMKGLEDERPLEESISNVWERWMDLANYRVKDVFYYYFLERTSPNDLPPDPRNTPVAVRDRLIETAKYNVGTWN
jgi:hypothetical protein